ncbi:amino acid/amide ABC transporter ATP-binding protein 1, HAAT family [Desulfacinum hydrothermale DSM 13146]|uniref:Amino acid/amide ABC transporter ATP-binding protein 1, HAAT family n=1 Tax=Desulfacinum hydrothermale DSM 13146 TaxID=1121390 RepID=A0A1W1XC20_9BACT|nr:ABC transporter ATP-binding protein [Desulfacinum hydrothermale]SMC21334.1 amino acid/amide ABC transporter ATP-binding protein 1, HAAT family [Desulfacinum hydrothermale DSM 13146]
MTPRPILEINRLGHQFGDFVVMRDISLAVQAGTMTALIGPNGAGKTTFYNLVSGRYQPTQGSIFFDGLDITRMPAHRRVALGLLRSFQITNIFPHLTVLENVLVPLALEHHKGFRFWKSMSRERDLKRQAEEILERVGLASEAHRRAHELAYGDQRLVEIAIVLARNPKLVLLDEPTAGMNPEETERMVHLIQELAQQSGTTFFLTEHDMNVVFSVASYLYVLHQGSLLAQGTPNEIRGNRQVKEAYLGGSLDS